MKAPARATYLFLLLMALPGCISLGNQEPQRHYVLQGAPAKADVSRTTRALTLLVTPAIASGFYDTREIAYSRAPGERAYYQFSSWTERPGRRITDLLVERLEKSGAFRTVAAGVSGVQGQLILNTHLTEFYHDAASPPGSARVALTAELTDPLRRTLVARRTFEQSAPAATFDAPGAVRAFDTAVAAMLDEVTAWVDSAAPR